MSTTIKNGNLVDLAQSELVSALDKEFLAKFEEKDKELDRDRNTNRLLRIQVPQGERKYVEEGNSLERTLRRVEGAVLQSDITNYTGISERLPRGDLIKLIQKYFGALEWILTKHNVEITKFLGDSVQAVGSVEDVMNAAPEIKYAMRVLEIDNTIGIGEGEYYRALIGDDQRLELITFGSAVNQAEELERRATSNQILTPRGEITNEVEVELREGTLLDKKEKDTTLNIFDRLDRVLEPIINEEGVYINYPEILENIPGQEEFVRQEKTRALIKSLARRKDKIFERLEEEGQELRRQNEQFGKRISPLLRARIGSARIGEDIVGLKARPATMSFVHLPFEGEVTPEKIRNHSERLFLEGKKVFESARGEVEKIIGTNVLMGSAGKTEGSEHHREEAQNANLKLREHLPKVRISTNTGRIIAGPVGSRERQEYTVTGDAVNAAARGLFGSRELVEDYGRQEETLSKLEGIVEQGQILIAQSTRTERSFIYCRDIEAIFKGKTEPQKLTELIGKKEVQIGLYEGRPLIGRDKEIERIISTLETEKPNIFGLTGDGGIGKSRLSYEVEGIATKEYDYKIYHTVCMERDKDRPFSGLFGWTRNIEGKFSNSVTGKNILTGLTKEEISEGLIEEIADFFLLKSNEGEKVIAQVRDAHNIDRWSRDVLRKVTERIKDKVTVWYNTRPGPSLIPGGEVITLSPLDEEGTIEYIQYLVKEEGEPYDEDKAYEIVTKSMGVPLRIELYTRYSIDGRGDELPSEIEDLVSERIASLDRDSEGKDAEEVAEVLSLLREDDADKIKVITQRIVKGDVEKGLDALLISGMWDRSKGKLTVHHDIKTIVDKHIEPNRRQSLHHRIAIALEDTSLGTNRELAYHYEQVLVPKREGESDEDRKNRWKKASLEVKAKASYYKEQFGLELVAQPVEREHGLSSLWEAYEILDNFRDKARILMEIQKVGMYLDEGGILPKTIEEFERLTREIRFSERGEERLEEIKRERLYNAVAVGFEIARRGNYQGALDHFNSLEKRITGEEQDDEDLLFTWFRRKAVCVADVARDMVAEGRFDEAVKLCFPEVYKASKIVRKAVAKDESRKAESLRVTGMMYKKLEDAYLNQSKLIKGDGEERERLLEEAEVSRNRTIENYENERNILNGMRDKDPKRLIENSKSLGWAYYFVDDREHFELAEGVVNEGLQVASELRLRELRYDLLNVKKAILGEYVILEATQNGDPLRYAYELEEISRELMKSQAIQVANSRREDEDEQKWKIRKDKISGVLYGSMRFRAMSLYYLGDKEKAGRIYDKGFDREKRLGGYQFTASLREYEKDKLEFDIPRIQEL